MKLNILLIALVILAWAYTSDQDNREADREQRRYNEMRQLYSQTQGEYGWPAHNQHREEVYQENKNDQTGFERMGNDGQQVGRGMDW